MNFIDILDFLGEPMGLAYSICSILMLFNTLFRGYIENKQEGYSKFKFSETLILAFMYISASGYGLYKEALFLSIVGGIGFLFCLFLMEQSYRMSHISER